MQLERRPKPRPQEIRVVPLAPGQTLLTMQQAFISLLQTLPTPITITEHQDTQQQTYYTSQVDEQTEKHPFGFAMGATPAFLDAIRFSLEAAVKHNTANNNMQKVRGEPTKEREQTA